MATTAMQPATGVQKVERVDPWEAASQQADALGWSLALFGYPGAGKTTFGAGPRTLIVDLEQKAGEVLGDRSDVMIWPKKNPDGTMPKIDWDAVIALSERLATGNHPFEVIVFDTLSIGYRMCLAKIMKSSPTPDTPSQNEYGKANELMLDLIRRWCTRARETGVNVVFNIHAAEVVDEATKTLLIRMELTPGVIKGLNQVVSAIGYLACNERTQERALLLKSTAKVLAKYGQNQTGPQLPLEIKNPSLGKILEHREKVRRELKAKA